MIISKLRLSPTSSFLSFSAKKDPQIQFNAWDFGGQSVFHSTHRFFVTPYALYLVLYDISCPESIDGIRFVYPSFSSFFNTETILRYWTEQVAALPDFEGCKPMMIVGTHADKLNKHELRLKITDVQKMYSTSSAYCNQLHGHFVLSMTPGMAPPPSFPFKYLQYCRRENRSF